MASAPPHITKPISALPSLAPPINEYSAHMLHVRLEKMLSHSDGVLAGNDTEPIHQMRVWARRTRSALEIFGISFSRAGKQFADIEMEIKHAADSLGEARDLDVMCETLAKLSGSLPENERPGIIELISGLKEDRALLQPLVQISISKLKDTDLLAVVDKIVHADRHHKEDQPKPEYGSTK